MSSTLTSQGLLRLDPLASPSALDTMGQLLDRTFPVVPGGTYFEDFPVWKYGSADQLVRYGMPGPKGELQSCAAGRFCFLRTPMGGMIPIGLIGAVATHPDARNQGLASQTVRAVADELGQRGAAAVFLWGSEHTMYQRLGFELCGEQSRIPLSQLDLPSADLAVGLQLERVPFSDDIFELQKRRRHGLALSNQDRDWMGRHAHTEWWTAKRGGKVIAFLAYLRGMDMQGIVHEWGGTADALRVLLDKLRRTHPHAELLCNDTLLREAGFRESVQDIEYLCLGKIYQPQAFLGGHGRGHQARCLPRFDKASGETLWEVTLQFHPKKIFTSRELSKLFFGPEKFSEMSGLQDSWDPLPLWFWGLDAA